VCNCALSSNKSLKYAIPNSNINPNHNPNPNPNLNPNANSES